MFTTAATVGNQTKVKAMKTATGLKDTYLEVFIDRMAKSYKNKRGVEQKQNALDEFKQSLPVNVLSPVWQIKGMQNITCR